MAFERDTWDQFMDFSLTFYTVDATSLVRNLGIVAYKPIHNQIELTPLGPLKQTNSQVEP